jgi:DNA-binding LytR/AlgR family response regulator
MINIVLCDDENRFLDNLYGTLRDVIAKSRYASEKIEIMTFQDSAKTLEYCLKNEVHILFLDIDMPVMTGFDIANKIRENNDEVKIIFVSAFENLVYTSFRYHPFRFIRKGCVEKEIAEAFDAAMRELFYKNMYISAESKTESVKVFYSDIVLIESRANYVEIMTLNGSKIKYRTTMNSLEKELCGYGFVRIHSGYIVSMSKIKYYKNDTVELYNGKLLKVSRKYYADARETYRKYLRNEI